LNPNRFPCRGRVMPNTPPSNSHADAFAIAAFLLALTGLFLFRRLWLRLLGPVFVYEADRTARRGRTFALRGIYVLSLLFVIYLTHPRISSMSVKPVETVDLAMRRGFAPPMASTREDDSATVNKVMGRFATQFSNAFLVAQAVVVLLLTPV